MEKSDLAESIISLIGFFIINFAILDPELFFIVFLVVSFAAVSFLAIFGM
jgi:hypothetical protein